MQTKFMKNTVSLFIGFFFSKNNEKFDKITLTNNLIQILYLIHKKKTHTVNENDCKSETKASLIY